MTQQSLDSLDAELKAGSITDEDYMQMLVDEVIRLHPDIDAYEVDNMVRLQLKSLAVEEQYCADIEERQQNIEIGTAPVKKENDNGAKQDSNGEEKAAASQEEENGSEARSESSEAESTSDAKKDGNEQSQETSENGNEGGKKKDSSDTKSADDADGNEESKSEGKDEDGDKSPEDNDGDKEDKSDSNDDKDNDGQGGNECWWTWQIVPGWLTLGTKEN